MTGKLARSKFAFVCVFFLHGGETGRHHPVSRLTPTRGRIRARAEKAGGCYPISQGTSNASLLHSEYLVVKMEA